MANVFKLFNLTKSAKSWGARDVIDEVSKDLNAGVVPDNARMIVIYTDAAGTPTFNTNFYQCGMSASETIMLLEIAKMDIYKKQMCNEK